MFHVLVLEVAVARSIVKKLGRGVVLSLIAKRMEVEVDVEVAGRIFKKLGRVLLERDWNRQHC